MRTFEFDCLEEAPLIIDATYKTGNGTDIRYEPLHVLLPRTSNQGGFRITHRADDSNKPAYVVIYTSLSEIEWPDFLDAESGVFRYYGDNRKPGNGIHETSKKGNQLLRDVFQWLNEEQNIKNIPPFLIFKKTGEARNVQFLGLAVPGNNNIPPDRDLIAFWRTLNGERFQNYEAYFSILDLKGEVVSKEWLKKLIYDHDNSLADAPKAWRDFIKHGRNGIKPLKSPKIQTIPTKDEQLPTNSDDIKTLEIIRTYYTDNPYGFEKCATRIVQLMDEKFYEFELTRPWRDGGRDAIGKYRIGLKDHSLLIECALEAKCYSADNSVGVKQMSRLISRIKYRQFGIMVTTSYIHKQAYSEIIEDGHPILVVNAKDIATILRENGISKDSVKEWLKALDY